jgi:hypothetical protein
VRQALLSLDKIGHANSEFQRGLIPILKKQANDQNFLARQKDLEVALGESKLDPKGNRRWKPLWTQI